MENTFTSTLTKEEAHLLYLISAQRKDNFLLTSKESIKLREAYLGAGCTRKVYQISDRYVVKVELVENEEDLENFGGNKQEWDFYQQIKDNPISIYFAKPFFLTEDNSILIMEYIPFSGSMISVDYKKWKEIKTTLREEYEIVDLHDSNWGINDNNDIKVFDYACNSSAKSFKKKYANETGEYYNSNESNNYEYDDSYDGCEDSDCYNINTSDWMTNGRITLPKLVDVECNIPLDNRSLLKVLEDNRQCKNL